MRIDVKLFASAAESAGTRHAVIEMPEGRTVADLQEMLAQVYPSLRPLLPRLVCAVNESYEPPATVLHDGDEVAIIPPVSGGG
jgi:molybdopterin synthase catalytic subunit